MSPVLADAPDTAEVTDRDLPPPTIAGRTRVILRVTRDLVTVAVWSVLAVVGGMALAAGLSLVGWAIGGFGSTNTGGVLQAGIDVFAAGQGLPLRLGAGVLTLTPLAVTALSMVMLGTMIGRGRLQSDRAALELANVTVAAVVYGIAATVGARLFATPGAVVGADWWRPTVLAGLVLIFVLVRGSALSSTIQARLPDWAAAAVRAGTLAATVMVGGAAVVLIIGAVSGAGRAGHVLDLSAAGFGPGVGLALTSAAFVPNAVLASVGYVSGAGFSIGSATYSPLGSHLGALPAFPLLTAAPDDPGSTYVGLLVLAVPVLAGGLAGWVLLRRIDARLDRLFGAAATGVVGGTLLAVAAALGGGGVQGGPWAKAGAEPWRLALTAGVELALVAGVVAVLGPDRGGPQPSLREIFRSLRRDPEVPEPEGIRPDQSPAFAAPPGERATGERLDEAPASEASAADEWLDDALAAHVSAEEEAAGARLGGGSIPESQAAEGFRDADQPPAAAADAGLTGRSNGADVETAAGLDSAVTGDPDEAAAGCGALRGRGDSFRASRKRGGRSGPGRGR